MSIELLRGELVRLTAEEPKVMGELFQRWSADSEFWRLLTTEPYRRYSARQSIGWWEKALDKAAPEVEAFAIRTLADDRIVGSLTLDEMIPNSREAWVGIGIGLRADWGRGYGTDAMRLLLKYAFSELNLHRVNLDYFEYNPRAGRSYEKVGFKYEGVARQFMLRDGRRWDLIFMGILRSDWDALMDKGTTT